MAFKIAILGTRGIPANYGGFETFAQELSKILAFRGHKVSVYARTTDYSEPAQYCLYKTGQLDRHVLVKCLPTIFHKYLETIVHTFLSFIDCTSEDTDLIILCNAANSPWIPIARLRGIPVIVNVDGVERKRTKWNLFGKIWYLLGEVCSVMFANRLVADAKSIESYYKKVYGIGSSVIAYGAERIFVPADKLHTEFGLNPKNYILYVSRLEPENNALGVIKAYIESKAKMPLVIVGDAPYAAEYKKSLQDHAKKLTEDQSIAENTDRRIIFAGFRFAEAYRELREHCYMYIQATQVGGTHPALVEAMAHANCIIANDVPEHKEVLEDAGLYYEYNNFEELALRINQLAEDAHLTTELGFKALKLAQQKYTWGKIADQYEALIRQQLGIYPK